MMKRGWRAAGVALGVLVAAGIVLTGIPSPAAALPPATVTMTLASPFTVPGRCDDATLMVGPDKTGRPVLVQRLVNGAWSTMRTGTLSAGSTVTIPLCFGWSALG